MAFGMFCRLTDAETGKVWYIEWSTICDAPLSEALTREEMIARLYEPERARRGDPPGVRLARLDATGTTCGYDPSPAEEMLAGVNRAGPNETCLTVPEILALCLSWRER